MPARADTSQLSDFASTTSPYDINSSTGRRTWAGRTRLPITRSGEAQVQRFV